ncbi:hypothetical protein PMAYCL1PPCAC_13355, partial [Pristionchus mayeri]
GNLTVIRGETLNCRKVGCAEFSSLTLGEGVQMDGNNLACSDASIILKTSSGIASSSISCDESSGLYKNGDKNVSRGENITCEKDPARSTATPAYV